MNISLGIATSKLRNAQQQADIRRKMWLSFEERLKVVFAEIDNCGRDADELRTLHLSFIHSYNPTYHKPWVNRLNSINQAQVSVGWRRLRVWHLKRGGVFNPEPNVSAMPELFNTKRFKRGSSLVRLYCRLKRLVGAQPLSNSHDILQLLNIFRKTRGIL